MSEHPREKQTGSFTIRDDRDGTEKVIKVISQFIDVSTVDSKTREWSENKKKRYVSPDGREGNFIDGSMDQFAFFDNPSRLFSKNQ